MRATHDIRVMVESSDKTWSTREQNGKPSLFLPWEPHEKYKKAKKKKNRTLEDELPRSIDAQYATGEQWRNNSRKNEETEQKQQQYQLWMWLLMEVKSNAVRSNIA